MINAYAKIIIMMMVQMKNVKNAFILVKVVMITQNV